MIAKFNENSSGSECKPDSKIQRLSEGAKERGRKTSGSRRSRRMGGGKNIE